MPVPVSPEYFDFCYHLAMGNWLSWRSSYESRDADTVPVLNDLGLFRVFLKEYGLNRKINVARSAVVLEFLQRVAPAFESGNPAAIDRPDFQDCYGVGRSALSKVAVFVCPKKYMAFDRFASKSIFRLHFNGSVSVNYINYISGVFGIIDGDLGGALRAYLGTKEIPKGFEDALLLRVLDVYLMLMGGRWVQVYDPAA